MSVEDDLLKIKEIKKSLNTAIRAKGSDIADDTKFDQYPVKIDGIETGIKEVPTYKINKAGDIISEKIDLSKKFDGIKNIRYRGLYHTFYAKEFTSNNLEFPDLETIENYGMYMAFRESYAASVSFPKLTTIGENGMYQTFADTKYKKFQIEIISFPKLTTIGESGMYGCFQNLTRISKLDFPNLTSIGRYGMYYCFERCNQLTSVNFPELIQIQESGFQKTFSQCSALKECNFPKLNEIQYHGLSYCFENCSSLTKISFPSLTTVGNAAFGQYSSNFAFYECTALTEIHFPAAIQTTIEGLTGYSDKWGATNATIYFDL